MNNNNKKEPQLSHSLDQSMQARRRSARVAELPPRIPPAHLRPSRGSDVLTLLIDYPQQEVLAMALGNCSAASLLSLELVSKRVRQALHAGALDDVWAAHVPMQLTQSGFHAFHEIGQNGPGPSDLAPRGQYLRSRHATIQLRHVVDGAKTKYKIKTGRNGAIESFAHPSRAPHALGRMWQDVILAVLSGADVQLSDNSGQTLLHWAVCLGDFKMARELCKAGLSPIARAKPLGPNSGLGHRPVDVAIAGSRIEDLLNEYYHQGLG